MLKSWVDFAPFFCAAKNHSTFHSLALHSAGRKKWLLHPPTWASGGVDPSGGEVRRYPLKLTMFNGKIHCNWLNLTMFYGKTHYFNWDIFDSYVSYVKLPEGSSLV